MVIRESVDDRIERNVVRGRKGEMVLMVGEKEMLLVVGKDRWC